MVILEIINRQKSGYFEVWLTNEEQQLYSRSELTALILSKADAAKCRVMFFLSGSEELLPNTEKLLIMNSGCR